MQYSWVRGMPVRSQTTGVYTLWCLGAAPRFVLFLHSLLLTVPSLLGSNSRNERAALLSYLVSTF